MIDQRIAGLKPPQIPLLAKLARVPETIRGFGHVKEANIKQGEAEKARLEAELESGPFERPQMERAAQARGQTEVSSSL